MIVNSDLTSNFPIDILGVQVSVEYIYSLERETIKCKFYEGLYGHATT